jgi:hypothetical protein
MDDNRMNKSGIAAGVMFVVGVGAVGSYLSPHFTVFQMKRAIDARDTEAFSEYVDFPALRENFKAQMMLMVGQQMSSPDTKDNPVAGFGQMLATAVIGPMIDAMISPAGVMAMMNKGSPKVSPKLLASIATDAFKNPGEGRPEYNIAYASWSKVRLTAKSPGKSEGNFVLNREGLWSWKLAGVEIPEVAAAEK